LLLNLFTGWFSPFIFPMKNGSAILILLCITVGMFLSCVTRVSVERKSYWNSNRSQPLGTIYIVIDKSDYKLRVFDAKGWFATYPVVFGNNNLGDKKMQGDRQTPEGTFVILNKRRHEKWNKFLLLDYPNNKSWEKFKAGKENGNIPTTAKIGGQIGIHGTLRYFDGVVDAYTNWTEGCISLKNNDLDELYELIVKGTKVKIRK